MFYILKLLIQPKQFILLTLSISRRFSLYEQHAFASNKIQSHRTITAYIGNAAHYCTRASAHSHIDHNLNARARRNTSRNCDWVDVWTVKYESLRRKPDSLSAALRLNGSVSLVSSKNQTKVNEILTSLCSVQCLAVAVCVVESLWISCGSLSLD